MAVVSDSLVVFEMDEEADDVLDGWVDPVVEAEAVVVFDNVGDLETEGLADTVFVEVMEEVVVLVDPNVIVAAVEGDGDHVMGGLGVKAAVAEDVLERLVVRVDVCDL